MFLRERGWVEIKKKGKVTDHFLDTLPGRPEQFAVNTQESTATLWGKDIHL